MTESKAKCGCKKPSGKLAVLTIGLGAVSTTFMAGVELSRKGLGKPIGSLTQMGTAAFGKNDVCQKKMIKDLVPLADLNDLVFGAWDVVGEDGLTVAKRSAVLNDKDIAACADFLKAIKPRPGIHDPMSPTLSVISFSELSNRLKSPLSGSVCSAGVKSPVSIRLTWPCSSKYA